MAVSPEFLAEQEERLRAEKTRLEEELGRIAKRDPALAGDYDAMFPEYGRDLESAALEEEGYEARRGVEQSLELHLRDVSAALARIAAGAYGTCAVCSEDIGEERLRAFPAANTCIVHSK